MSYRRDSHRKPTSHDILAQIASGKLKVDERLKARIVRQIIDEHLSTRWVKPPQTRQEVAAIGSTIVAVIEIGQAIYHVLSEHGEEILQVVLAKRV